MPNTSDVFARVDAHIAGLFATDDDALSAALRDMETHALPAINVSAVQGKFLYTMAKLAGVRRVLEIGTLGGYSAIWMARALPADGELLTLEIDAKHADVARQNLARAKIAARVDVRVGRALDLLPQLAADHSAPFDLIFIDAHKPPYLEYFQWALRMSRPGTLIVADNVIRSGRVVDDAAASDEAVVGVKRLSAFAATYPGIDATIIQTVGPKGHDGMLLAVVKDFDHAAHFPST